MFKMLLKMIGHSALLSLGVIIGVLLAPRLEKSVRAQGPVSTTAQSPQEVVPSPPSRVEGSPRIETLQSYSTTGVMGSNILLAHNLQADIAVVNGYDLMKINQQILNYLATLPVGDQRALAAIVRNSRAEVLYQFPAAAR